MKDSYPVRLICLLAVAAIVLAAGLGLRDPWPADEPRFALIAKDMVESGSWFLPRAGGVLYPDKPPVFFWLIAMVYAVTGSIRVSFLLPGVVAGLGSLWLVADLARRLWGRKTAIWCGASLLALVQFPLQMKSGQIDGWLCLMTTLGLYGLCRHLLLGPDWRWYIAGCFAAGLGVITKGVGFLPLLIFVPYVLAARAGWPVTRHRISDSRWLAGPIAFFAAIGLWLVPMLLATAGGADPDLLEYRNNILFHQTVTRYADSWGHIKPPWYFLTNAIPWLWLPASLLLPWLLPAWRKDLKDRNGAVLMLGSWVLLVLLFFSLSMGKRSLYIFPAAPAFAMIAGYHAEALLRRAGAQRILVMIPAAISLGLIAAGMYTLMNPNVVKPWLPDILALIETGGAVLATGIVMLGTVMVCRRRRALTGYAISMAAFWIGLSLLVAPALNGTRSGAALIERVGAEVAGDERLGFVAWPEQFLLHWDRPADHFGFRRDPEAEVRDSAAWLQAAEHRRVLLPEYLLEPCYDPAAAVRVGLAHRREWVLVDRDALLDACAPETRVPEQVVHYAHGPEKPPARDVRQAAALASPTAAR